MKNAIRLLVLAGALLSVGALAQAGNATNFNFNFPAYAFVFTNVETVTFDFDQLAGSSQLESVSGYYEASSAGLEACLDALLEDNNGTLDGTGSYTIQSPSTTSNTCKFAPTSISKYAGAFTVDWGTNSPKPDGELLVITNAGGYTVTATFADNDNDWPGGLNIDIIAGVVDSAGALSSSSSISLGSTASATFNQNDDYTTQFANAYVIPQLYALQLDVMSASINTTAAADASVTYTVTAP